MYSRCVRVAQLEEVWTVNREVGRSSPSWVKLTKSLQQAFNPKIAGFFGSRPKLGGPVYHNNIVGTLKIHLCPSHIGQVLRLLNECFIRSLGECYVCPFLGSHNTYLIGQPAFCTFGLKLQKWC